MSSDLNASPSDLRRLGAMIRDARIVALSEGVHGGAEPLAFRNRLFKFLVEELGFTAIAIESGITESRVVHDYVLGSPEEIETVIEQGFGWTFDRFPQNEELVQWMREYNMAAGPTEKIRFFGFDVPGSPTNGWATRGVASVIEEPLRYIGLADPEAAASVEARIRPLLPSVRLDLAGATPPSQAQYFDLSQGDRDLLTATIADMISLFERREVTYVANGSSTDYEWAYRMSIGARQTDAYLRRIPGGWTGGQPAWIYEALQVRGRAMADNVSWIIDQLGKEKRLLLFGHRVHMAAVPMVAGGARIPLGAYLRQKYGNEVVALGNVVGEGEVGCRDQPTAKIAPSTTSVDGLLAQLDVPLFVLDLRTAPPDVARWLHQTNVLSDGLDTISLDVADAFDVLLFTGGLTPACPPDPGAPRIGP
jgi:erythromycin esterase